MTILNITIVTVIISAIVFGIAYIARRCTRKIVLDSLHEYNRPKPDTFECANALILKKNIVLRHKDGLVTAFDGDGDILTQANSDNIAYRLLECYGLTTNNFVRNKKGKVVMR